MASVSSLRIGSFCVVNEEGEDEGEGEGEAEEEPETEAGSSFRETTSLGRTPKSVGAGAFSSEEERGAGNVKEEGVKLETISGLGSVWRGEGRGGGEDASSSSSELNEGG